MFSSASCTAAPCGVSNPGHCPTQPQQNITGRANTSLFSMGTDPRRTPPPAKRPVGPEQSYDTESIADGTGLGPENDEHGDVEARGRAEAFGTVIALLRFLFGGAESSPCGAPCVLPY